MNAEESQLIALARQGQTEAFGELVRRYQDRLYNVVYGYLNDAEEAQDVVQEAFLSAFQSVDGFKGGSRFFTWLYRIAINHAIDLKRKRRALVRREVIAADDLQPEDVSVDSRPDAPVERNEEAHRVRRALARLSPEHRLVLVLKEMDGLRYEEIAAVINVPIGTVRSRLHRARLELRDILENEEKLRDGTAVLGARPLMTEGNKRRRNSDDE